MITKTSREEFLDSVVSTALEGGIGYWSVCSSYKWMDVPETVAIIQKFDEATGDVYGDKIRVDRALIEKGIKEILSGETNTGQHMVKMVAVASVTDDAGDVDADVADCIVQVGAFGNLVYG
ncbi:MAG: hypothetical protein NTW48_08350 [Chloroflexi bacterium]|nr:hypothetical protein [Chloroflexota bacterium]